MWLLISTTKKNCFRIWLIFFTILSVLNLLQSWSGKLAGMTAFAWMWLLLVSLPGLLVLFISILTDRQSAKLISRFAHRSLYRLSIAYLFLVLCTLLAEQWATQGSLSMRDYREQSFLWLLPLQASLVVGYILVFWSKKSIFINKLDIRQVADKEAAKWASQDHALRENGFQLIAQGEIGEALEKVAETIQQTGLGDLQEVTLLQAQWQENKKNQRLHLLSHDEIQRNDNRIAVALMDLLQQI